jgi:hypothetical protein
VSRSILVYDDSTEWLRTAAGLVASAADDVRPVPWNADAVQAFLGAQFDDRPFALFLIETDTVYVGKAAVERLLQQYGIDGELAKVFKRLYPPFSAPFGRLVHGQTPDDLHGTFPLDAVASEHLAPLRESVEIPVEPE